ncbi:M20 family metallopeptidase [bacterium]|nr:M20 family metallopeptidase [bacterium]
MSFDTETLKRFINDKWDHSIIQNLSDYIKIPNKSPAFDKNWQNNGFIDQVVKNVAEWCQQQNVFGLKLSIERIEGRTPLLFIDVDSSGNDSDSVKTVLLYGHLDKQPEMVGWDEDKGPWKPVMIDDKLYGRGAADDGYAVFSAITAIKALQEQGVPHARCVLIIESCEEGGSSDLPFYIDKLQNKIGTPDLVICLDSGCGNYDQLWLTTSLRGAIIGELSVELLKEGIHSGNGGGVIASSFRVLRDILDRLEDTKTGRILIDGVNSAIPDKRVLQAEKAAEVLGKDFEKSFPLLENVKMVSDDPKELILNRTWRPSLSYTGIDGIPNSSEAGNVLRPFTSMKLSLRLPPTIDAKKIINHLKEILESKPPYNAKVQFKVLDSTKGWNSPELSGWLEKALDEASLTYFGRGPVFMGEGGSIPFMNLLATKFPEAQFMITGVLGPHSNAHGPNEFLHIPTVKKLTCCIAQVLSSHAVT